MGVTLIAAFSYHLRDNICCHWITEINIGRVVKSHLLFLSHLHIVFYKLTITQILNEKIAKLRRKGCALMLCEKVV